eukprot:scaffold3317_cov288-Prasinococcus_capsulatus_cf.AAC.3
MHAPVHLDEQLDRGLLGQHLHQCASVRVRLHPGGTSSSVTLSFQALGPSLPSSQARHSCTAARGRRGTSTCTSRHNESTATGAWQKERYSVPKSSRPPASVGDACSSCRVGLSSSDVSKMRLSACTITLANSPSSSCAAGERRRRDKAPLSPAVYPTSAPRGRAAASGSPVQG